jgi:hypothetical protein
MSEATTATAATTSRIAITETTKIIEATNNVLTIIRHALNSNGKKVTNNKKLRMIEASTLASNHSESDDEIFALEKTHNRNNNEDQSNIIKQDYVLEIAIGVLADVATK